jgi:WD40 repeat protein
MFQYTLVLAAIAVAPFFASAQVVDATPSRTIRTSKAAVTSLAIAPKGDRVLVGTNKGAELYDLESGKKLHAFPYNEDGSTAVYHTGFNENGEFVVLIGHTGKRQVYDVKSGKQDKIIAPHRWIPDSRVVKTMGLDMKNSAFDRFYQQSEVEHNGHTLRAVKDGTIEVVNGTGEVVQKLEYPENKDQHHRAPLLVHEGQLFTGTDDGRVLVYKLQ